MKQLKCETCGATLELSGDGLHAQCPMCGNVYEYRSPKEEMAVHEMNEANDLRINMNFDDAIKKYRMVTKSNPEDAEGYWGLLLSKYGIAYEYEPDTKKYVPTFHRNRRGNILEDVNAKNALKYASDAQRAKYETALGELRYIQEGIENFADNCDPYDVFISFKATEIGSEAKTIDRDIAYNIYDELNSRGIRTFFSEVSLRSMVAEDYEAVIFSALNTCRVFILVGTSKDNIESLWVKNEWTRYSERVADDRLNGLPASSRFAVIGGTLKPSELPREFARTQNVLLSNYAGDSYKKDVAYSVEKLLGIEKKDKKPDLNEANVKEMLDKLVKEKVGANGGKDYSSLLKRAFMFLADGKFDDADSYAERVLDIDPECGEAYLAKLLAKYKCRTREALGQLTVLFGSDDNYLNILKYGTSELKAEVEKYCKMAEKNLTAKNTDENVAVIANDLESHITDNMMYIAYVKQDIERLEPFRDWRDTASLIAKAENFLSDSYDKAAALEQGGDAVTAIEIFKRFGDYKDAKKHVASCEAAIKEGSYLQGKKYLEEKNYEGAMFAFQLLKGYKDSDKLLDDTRIADETDKVNAIDNMVEEGRVSAAKRALPSVRKLAKEYNHESVLDLINGVDEKIAEAQRSTKYWEATTAMDSGKFDDAMKAFEELKDYQDSVEKIKECKKKQKKAERKAKHYDKTHDIYGKYTGGKKLFFKIIIVAALIAAAVFGCMKLYEKMSSEVVDGIVYQKVGDSITVIKLDDKDLKDIVIKDKIDGKLVTAIGNRAFMDTDIESVHLPLSVSTIGNSAFESCSDLVRIDIEHVKKIGNRAFKDCIVAELSGAINAESIGEYAFENCNWIYHVNLTNPKLTTITTGMFYGCDALKSFEYHSDMTQIGDKAFAYCAKLNYAPLMDSITSIGAEAFKGCTALENVVMPDSITSIGESAYENCVNINNLHISESLTTIPKRAFAGISELDVVVLPDSVANIEERAFASNHAKEIVFGANPSLTTIKSKAFTASSFEDIVLPDTVKVIETKAFADAMGHYLFIPKSVTEVGKDIALGANFREIHVEASSKGADWDEDWSAKTRYLLGDHIKHEVKYDYKINRS